MGTRLHTKEEIRNLLLAAQTATMELAQRTMLSRDLEAYLDGYATALMIVAQGLGIEFEPEHPNLPELRVWQENLGLLATAKDVVPDKDVE